MKKVLLTIVLGLFAVGCEGPMSLDWPEDEDWKCPGDDFSYLDREDCFDNCEEDCYECEWVDTNWGSTCE